MSFYPDEYKSFNKSTVVQMTCNRFANIPQFGENYIQDKYVTGK